MIKAEIQEKKKGFILRFDSIGAVVKLQKTQLGTKSFFEGEDNFYIKPILEHMKPDKKQLFGQMSAQISYGSLINALRTIAPQLETCGLYPEDLYGALELIMEKRSAVRGKPIEYLTDVQRLEIKKIMKKDL